MASPAGNGSSKVTPYDVIIGFTNTEVYRIPSKGFKARMITLAVLNVVFIFGSLAYLGITHRERQRNTRQGSDASYQPKSQRAFWLFRRVDRSSGKLIIPNHRILGAAFVIAVAVTWIGLALDSIKVFIERGAMRDSFGWRAFLLMPMFGHGWITVWTSLTTFLMTTDRHSTFTVSSTLVNIFFVGVFVGGLGMAIICSCVNFSKGLKFWSAYLAFKARLENNDAAYPNLPADAYNLTLQQATEVRAAGVRYFRSGAYTFGPCIILPLAIIVVVCLLPPSPGSFCSCGADQLNAFTSKNVAALFLCRVLQKQIDYNKEQLISAITTEHQLTTSLMQEAGIPRRSSTAVLKRLSLSKGLSLFESTASIEDFNGKRLSASQIRRMSKLDARSHCKDRARTIIVLTRARWELLLFSINAAVISMFIIGILSYLTIICHDLTIVTGTFSRFESAVYVSGWFYTTLSLVTLVLLLFQAFQYSFNSVGGAIPAAQAMSEAGVEPIVRPSHSRSCSFVLPPPPLDRRGSGGSDVTGRRGNVTHLFGRIANPWARRNSSFDSTNTKPALGVNMVVERAVREEMAEEEVSATTSSTAEQATKEKNAPVSASQV
ncbi:BZ3500_MvSof-1268-A1-R1_Chr3-1g05973 [Microbotryum saponariae]|uniref:BZ3500_MvSof-1268-A1-R1_Chr3-1g05973 protein n=1 Tax=Microbotryum saponariae TaxID=289078 RepID=A0A2X0M033_9BASI|nr:BZ3500_MvSof-1268-A1-R1_Chr3-1g05973 [Microbotryum saponariae]SDA05163.1 BZ3501_MvSof-1269-A2-R1_Chr3-1g05643 [Microbotryum saponariae]